MNAVLVRYDHPFRTKQYTKKSKHKHAVKAKISMKKILFNIWAKRAAFPASGRVSPNTVCVWRHREHGNSNKRRHKWRFEPSQEMCVQKMANGNVCYELNLLWFTSVYGSFIINWVSPLFVRLQKDQERLLCKTYLFTMSYLACNMLRRKWQFHLGNIRKITKNSNITLLLLEIGWSYHRGNWHDNLQGQAQRHISTLC